MVELIPLTLEYCEQVYKIARECLPEHWSLDGIKDVLKYDNNIYYIAVLSQDEKNTEEVNEMYAGDEFNSLNKTGILDIKSNRVVGFGGIMIVADEAELLNIAVTKEYRGKNIASDLMDRLLREANNKDCVRMLLEVRESNDAAQHLYRKKNFAELGVRKNYYDNPTENAIIMERKLL